VHTLLHSWGHGALVVPMSTQPAGSSDHRIRLSDADLDLIVAALRSRAAMTNGLRRHRVERLAERLAECSRGNPKWLLDEERQTREELLDGE
jgi:hypothetical protein